MRLLIFILLELFCGLYFICFGQEKVKLSDGTEIVVYSNKTWKYKSEVQERMIDADAIVVYDLSRHKIWKYPLWHYSPELKFFSKNIVEVVGYSNGYFMVESTFGQIGYVRSFNIDNNNEYKKILDSRAVQRAKSEGRKILIKGVGVDGINSANGIDIFIDWGYFDYSKDIKYISFTVVPYNNVGDIQNCSISGKSAATCRITGPISASDSFNSSN